MTAPILPVAIIGAGPVGLFTALCLAQNGIKVTLYEAGNGIDQSPRAVAYFPPVLEEFAKAGVIADVIEAGEKGSDGCDWRDPGGSILASITPPPNNTSFTVALSQPELGEILLRKLSATGNAEVLFNESFSRLKEGEKTLNYWTINHDSGEEVEHQCQYLIGADGGRSAVRRSLGIELNGFSFDDFQFVAVNFQYPLTELGWKQASFIVDPVDWGVVVKRGKGTSWRFATGVPKSTSDKMTVVDEVTKEVIKKRLNRILPGDTSKVQYESMSPYIVHQRCAAQFRKGRVLLAGDAAHLNNPVGGLGLTTGLLDAAHLSRALKQVLNEGFDTRVLDSYAETRRRIFLAHTNPVSLANIRRLFSEEPEDVKKRTVDFAHLNDPKNFVDGTRIGLPDFALTSTSNRIFDTRSEVTFFISVTKLEDWTTERFTHEYKIVHAGMTRPTSEQPQTVQSYIQLSNSGSTIEGTERPPWDYVTCLTLPSLFIAHAGFADPGYKATAGAHIFCRLDQQGCLATKVARFSKGNPADRSDIGAVECLVFHQRTDTTDEYSDGWFSERAAKWEKGVASDDRLFAYTLWRDVTPKDTEYFFRDTQFCGGSWLNYKAVEAFYFEDNASSTSFLEQYKKEIYDTQIIIGVPDIII